MAGFNNASLLDVFNAGTNFGNTVMDQGNKWNKEAADIELNAMKNQFNSDVNDLFNKMQASNNYEDWNKDLNNFMEKTVASTGNKSAGNPYYCRNGYMAQAAKEMLEGQRVQLQAKVDQMVWAKETEHLTEAYQKNRDADRVNQLLTPQQKYDNGLKEARALYETGRISESAFNKEQDRLYQQTYSDAYISQVSGLFDTGIDNGWSFERIVEEAKKDPVTMKKLGLDGMEEAVDLTQLEATLKKSLKQDYQAKVKDLQDSNANKLAAIYRKVTAAETETGKLQAKREGQALLRTMEGGFKLDENRMTEYAYKFNIEPPKATKTGTGGSTSSSSSSGDTGDYTKAKTLAAWAKQDSESFYGQIKDGSIKPDEAKSAFYLNMQKALVKGEISDYRASNYDEAKNIIGQHGYNYIYDFYEGAVDAVLDQKRFSTANASLKKLAKDINDNPDEFGTTAGYLYEEMIDLIASNNVDNMTDGEIKDWVDKRRNVCYLEKMEKLMKGRGVREDGTVQFTSKNDVTNYLGQASDIYANNDVLFTDEKNRVKYRSEQDEKDLTTYAKTVTGVIAESLGKEPTRFKQTWEKDKYNDETSTPIITDLDTGKKYKIEPVYSNNDKKKVVDYKIVDEKGNLAKDKNGKELKYDYNKVKNREDEERKAMKKEADAKEKAAKAEQERIRQEEAEKARVASIPKILQNIDPGAAKEWTGGSGSVTDAKKIQGVTEKINQRITNLDNMQGKKTAAEIAQEKQKLCTQLNIPVNEYDDFVKTWKGLNNEKKHAFVLTGEYK